MLKINLLPIRQLKKRAKAKKQLFGMLLAFLLTLAAVALVGVLQLKNISMLETSIANLKKETDAYTPVLNKIAKLKKERIELDRKTGIINKLKSDSSLTVRVLDEVANRVDKNRIWLQSLSQQRGSLRLTGIALDNQTVAQFMDNLKASPFVKSVTLTNSSLKVVSGKNLKAFSLTCAVSQPVSPKPGEMAVKKST
jgi:type IV pilus assembly protein PilN